MSQNKEKLKRITLGKNIADMIVIEMANDYIYMKLLLKIIQCSLIPCLKVSRNNLILIW